uniref:Lipase domain-containing protein n=1 Tax=Timema monikensis TaxID=170555 RepID=A0A7R9EDJ0_9NEOP|nr:unnamed protein product [Timema monikensis]
MWDLRVLCWDLELFAEGGNDLKVLILSFTDISLLEVSPIPSSNSFFSIESTVISDNLLSCSTLFFTFSAFLNAFLALLICDSSHAFLLLCPSSSSSDGSFLSPLPPSSRSVSNSVSQQVVGSFSARETISCIVLQFLLFVSHLLAEQQDKSTGHNQSYPTKRFDAEKDVKFYLYTQNNPTSATSLSVGDVSTLANFNPDLSTKIIVHGWLAGPKDMDDSREGKRTTSETLIKYFLSGYSSSIAIVSSAVSSSCDHVSVLWYGLVTAGGLLCLKGLDPAAPLYGQESLENRLDPTDASFVEVVHTCAGLLGWADPLGHVDFYPNSGEPVQPGCGTDLAELGLGSCSHIRARALFAESITTSVGFVGVLCSDWKTYENDGCSHNPTALMGDPTDTSAKEGSYYLTTASSSPFAQG